MIEEWVGGTFRESLQQGQVKSEPCDALEGLAATS
jgi:hypothetical protein